MALTQEPMTDAVHDGWWDENDAEWALRTRTECAAFGVLYDRYPDRIYGYCYRRLQTREAAEDATSQTFL